ncbi:hypothetical protein ATCC90586_009572 [Pythium insidiosum]|nr:hypothetical protein ATCC90586_009572 [Pythium insidiosum]
MQTTSHPHEAFYESFWWLPMAPLPLPIVTPSAIPLAEQLLALPQNAPQEDIFTDVLPRFDAYVNMLAEMPLEEGISAAIQEDVPPNVPDLAPRVLHGLVDAILAAAELLSRFTKENDSIYFLPIPTQAETLAWREEMLTLQDKGLVVTRRRALNMIRLRTKLPWPTILGIQLEHNPQSGRSTKGYEVDMVTSVLLIASQREGMRTIEFRLQSDQENAVLVACLQRVLQTKRTRMSLDTRSLYPNFHAERQRHPHAMLPTPSRATPRGRPVDVTKLQLQPLALTSRSVALRGDLAVTSRPPSVATTRRPGVIPPVQLQELRTEEIKRQDVVCSARPRSRYARREITQPLERLNPTKGLARSVSVPVLRSRQVGEVEDDDRASKPSSSSVSPAQPVPLLSWTQQDTFSFFLTELDAQTAADDWKIAKAIASGSHQLYALNDWPRAVVAFSEALPLAEKRDDKALLALLHHHMGMAFREEKQERWALIMQKKTLELSQQCGDLRLQGRALKALGVLFLDRGDLASAFDCQQQALGLALETQDVELEARVHANLGNIASSQQQLLHAIACHERDLAMCLSAEIDSAVGQLRAHRNLALVYAKLGGAHIEQQLAHEVSAARLSAGASHAFETDMRCHPLDVVGNVYMQLTTADPRMAEMVASSLKDVLSDAGASSASAALPATTPRDPTTPLE